MGFRVLGFREKSEGRSQPFNDFGTWGGGGGLRLNSTAQNPAALAEKKTPRFRVWGTEASEGGVNPHP